MAEIGLHKLPRRTGDGASAFGPLLGAWLPLGLFHVVPFVLELTGLCILLAVMVAFSVSGYLWFHGQREEGLFTAIWVPSILGFGLYFKLRSVKAAIK